MAGNGSSTSSNVWIRMAENNGPAAIGLLAVCWAFWQFHLIPNAAERKTMVDVLTSTAEKNATSNETVAENSEVLKDSIMRQESTQLKMSDELVKQSDLRATAMDTMSAFAKEMREVNPANSVKLDVLLKMAETTEDNAKLDIIIEKIDALQAAEPPPDPQ